MPRELGARRNVPAERGEGIERSGVMQHVQVIENQDNRLVARREGCSKARDDCALDRDTR